MDLQTCILGGPVFDARGVIIQEKIYSPSGELLSHRELFYDLKGNQVRSEYHLPNEKIVSAWEYDSCSRLVKETRGVDTLEQLVTTFSYNAFGELCETQYPVALQSIAFMIRWGG